MSRRQLAAVAVSLLLLPITAIAQEPTERVVLFDGKDLSKWTAVSSGDAKLEDVWRIDDGVLVCLGKPPGYLRSKDEFENYVLTLEWRFPEGSPGGNSGVLVHTSTPGAIGIWPKSIEVQLHTGNAGDFWIIGTDLDVENEEQRKIGRRHLNLTDDSEKPIGQWNRMEITCRGDEILVTVNDAKVNHATACSVTKGAVCLQSEGTEIHFRNIVLTPLGK